MIDQDVIHSYKKGKRKGFDKIYKAYSPGMYAICLRYSRCPDDAQDMLQETFIKVYNYRDKYDPERSIGAWIKTITIRTALNYIKEQYRFTLTDDDQYFEAPSNQIEENDDKDLKDKLMEVLKVIQEGYRTVFSLYVMDNLTHKEIAEYLGVTEGTSKSQYSKAKKMIKNLLLLEKVAS